MNGCSTAGAQHRREALGVTRELAQSVVGNGLYVRALLGNVAWMSRLTLLGRLSAPVWPASACTDCSSPWSRCSVWVAS